jgi:hypothetical protein
MRGHWTDHIKDLPETKVTQTRVTHKWDWISAIEVHAYQEHWTLLSPEDLPLEIVKTRYPISIARKLYIEACKHALQNGWALP